MPGEQLIQTLPDPRLKSSPDRSRRCSFIFLKRFADGWKNQCPTEESGGGWSKGKKGRERERGMERKRRERGERSMPGEAGAPGGGGGMVGGLAAPTAIVCPRGLGSPPHMKDQGQSKASPSYVPWSRGTAVLRAPDRLVPPHTEHHFCSADGGPKSVPWGPPHSDTAGFHGNTSQFPHGDIPATHGQVWGKKPSRSTKLLGENSLLPCFFMKIALLRSPSSDPLCGCRPSTVLGSHPARAAPRGAPGWDRNPQCLCAGGPCCSSIVPILLGRDAAKRDFIPSGGGNIC